MSQEKGRTMEEDLKAQTEAPLRRSIAELHAIGQRLNELHARLPPSSREDAMLLGEDDPDYSFRVRTTIECAQRDHLDAAITALQTLLD
ncbi:MAG TPA: hypothetical protein DD490_12625 [Acidobacteria bacterium]|nr:hypothetical protein [Acidobacteriota bacterium]